MERKRQMKMMFIAALVLSITAMTLGFAAFSTTLSISSSATVTPNSDDFHVTITGYKMSCSPAKGLANCLSNSTLSYPTSTTGSATPATIDNVNGIISEISLSIDNFSYDSVLSNTTYLFQLTNDGKYNVYLDPKVFGDANEVSKTCIPGEGTSASMVEQACNNIHMVLSLHDNAGTSLVDRTSFMIAPGSNAIVKITYSYNHQNNSIPDGAFSIDFDDVQLVYSTQEQ